MQREAFAQLLFQRVQRVERGQGFLKNKADVVAANLTQGLVAGTDDFASLKRYGAFDRRHIRQQIDGGQGRQRFARPGFTDQRDRFTRLDCEADALDRLHFAEGHAQVTDFQQTHASTLRGSNASRTPSKTKTSSDSRIAKVKNAVKPSQLACKFSFACNVSSPSEG